MGPGRHERPPRWGLGSATLVPAGFAGPGTARNTRTRSRVTHDATPPHHSDGTRYAPGRSPYGAPPGAQGSLAQPVEAAALEAVRSGFESLEGYHIRRLGPNGRGTGFKLRSVMVRIHQAAPIRIVSLRGRQAVLKTVMTPKGWGFDSSAIRQSPPHCGCQPRQSSAMRARINGLGMSRSGWHPERGKWS